MGKFLTFQHEDMILWETEGVKNIQYHASISLTSDAFFYHHFIMPRTAINIDDPILKEIKDLQKKEGGTVGKIVSQLLAEALGRRKTTKEAPKLKWISRPMHARLDLADKDALYAILDRKEK